MFCIESNALQILWNCELAGTVNPTRGIIQGDLLSPYLFVVCIKRLSHLINDYIVEGSWKQDLISRGGPLLSRFFFADDVVLFAEASLDQISVIKSYLDRFCGLSMQRVSFEKSRISFSSNVPMALADQISSIVSIPITLETP